MQSKINRLVIFIKESSSANATKSMPEFKHQHTAIARSYITHHAQNEDFCVPHTHAIMRTMKLLELDTLSNT